MEMRRVAAFVMYRDGMFVEEPHLFLWYFGNVCDDNGFHPGVVISVANLAIEVNLTFKCKLKHICDTQKSYCVIGHTSLIWSYNNTVYALVTAWNQWIDYVL